MGVYLSKPNKEKISSNYENKFIKCGASSMQGWRVSQEDAHNCCLDFDTDVSLFAVYDGHGGHEVAEYASLKLPNFIKETEAYKKGDYENALKDAFLGFDATLTTESVLTELKRLVAERKKSESAETDDETEEDDVLGLKEEANMPLAEVIARYTNGTIPKTPVLQRLCRDPKSKSPFLRAKSSTSTASDSEVSSSSTAGASSSESNSTSVDNGCSSTTSACPTTSGSNSGKISSSSSEVVTNGIGEGNGEVKGEDISLGNVESGESSSVSPSTSKKVSKEEEDEVSSSSVVSGESSNVTKVDQEGVKLVRTGGARRNSKVYKSIMAEISEDSSDSDEENDASFNGAMADTSCGSDDEDEDAESGVDDETSEEEEAEEEEDDEEEEDEMDHLKEEGNEQPGADSGCTAVVALLAKDKVIVANAGDSRAVLCREGKAIDLSVDHKPEDTIEFKRIVGAGGRVTCDGRVNGGLNLSRALGDHMYKQTAGLDATEQMITALPDLKAVDIEAKDEFIVLACDGIWNSMTSQEVVDFVRPLIKKGESLSSICEKMFDNCLAEDAVSDGTGCDNMTCVIVELLHNQNGTTDIENGVVPVNESSKRKSEDDENCFEQKKARFEDQVDTSSATSSSV